MPVPVSSSVATVDGFAYQSVTSWTIDIKSPSYLPLWGLGVGFFIFLLAGTPRGKARSCAFCNGPAPRPYIIAGVRVIGKLKLRTLFSPAYRDFDKQECLEAYLKQRGVDSW